MDSIECVESIVESLKLVTMLIMQELHIFIKLVLHAQRSHVGGSPHFFGVKASNLLAILGNISWYDDVNACVWLHIRTIYNMVGKSFT